MASLHEIGLKHGTDKWDEAHHFLGLSYLDVYQKYFEELRDKPITFLELGVKGGGSLRMWKEYFPFGHVHGVDLNPDCLRHAEDRIEVHHLSQDDRDSLTALAESVGGFDVVLDDCSHINSLTLASLDILLPHVRPGGFYAIEDLGMSWVDYSSLTDQATFMDGELAMNLRRGVPPHTGREPINRRFEELIFDMDMLRGDMMFIHFWSRIAIAQKAPTQQRPVLSTGDGDPEVRTDQVGD